MSSSAKRNIVYLSLSVAITVPFLLLYSYYSSPLTSKYGYDQAFFQLVGMGMTDGLVPYRDFHDLKGPYLFFMEWLGQVICRGRLGCFCLQVLCMVPSLFLLFKIMELARANRPGEGFGKTLLAGLSACVPYLVVQAVSMSGGNLPEELSLPFLMLGLYCNLGYFAGLDSGSGTRYKAAWAFANGVCVCVMALMRITNAAFALATLLCVAVALLRRGAWRGLGRALAWFALGVVAACVPALAYCLATGTLSEMIYLVFLYGLSYSGGMGLEGHLAVFFGETGGDLPRMMLLALTPVAATALVHARRAWCWGVSLLGGAATFAGVFAGHGYLHYAGTVLPLMVLGFFLIAYHVPGERDAGRARRVAAGLLAGLLVVAQVPHFIGVTRYSAKAVEYRLEVSAEDRDAPAVHDIVDRIPPEERGSVFCFGKTYWSRWYCIAGIYPYHRYFDYQESHFAFDPALEEELRADMAEDPPLWLVTKGDVSLVTPTMTGIIAERYDRVYENDSYTLHRLRDSP